MPHGREIEQGVGQDLEFAQCAGRASRHESKHLSSPSVRGCVAQAGHGQGDPAFAAAWISVLFDSDHFIFGLAAWASNDQGIHGIMVITGDNG